MSRSSCDVLHAQAGRRGKPQTCEAAAISNCSAHALACSSASAEWTAQNSRFKRARSRSRSARSAADTSPSAAAASAATERRERRVRASASPAACASSAAASSESSACARHPNTEHASSPQSPHLTSDAAVMEAAPRNRSSAASAATPSSCAAAASITSHNASIPRSETAALETVDAGTSLSFRSPADAAASRPGVPRPGSQPLRA